MTKWKSENNIVGLVNEIFALLATPNPSDSYYENKVEEAKILQKNMLFNPRSILMMIIDNFIFIKKIYKLILIIFILQHF